jgi:hypothetical protein
MKTKAFLLVGIAALATLSFTFVNTAKPRSGKTENRVTTVESAPAGGFDAEEVVK